MRMLLATAAVSAVLILSGTAEAGRGGGRSFSSGRSSSFSSHGRSYSSGSSTSGRSHSSHGSLSGRSYSSGSGSSKATSSYGRPAAASSPNKPSVSSNPARMSAKTGPTSPPPSTNPNRPTGSASGTSAKSYSSGGKTYSAGPTAGSGGAPGGNGGPAGRHYSSGGSSPSGKSYTEQSSSTRPSSGSYDATAARSQQMAESKVAYLKGQQPKSSYTDRGGVSHPIDPKDRKIESLRRELDYRRWENRELRQREFFGRYYTYPPPVVVYHDPYSNFFWWWLLDRTLDERAYWAYNHRQSMDDARYGDLLARDANLEARIRELETQHVPHDPTYRPDNIDPDLMYSKSYVEAAYNPQPAVTAGRVLRAMITVFIVLAVIALFIWFVFYKRWGGIGD